MKLGARTACSVGIVLLVGLTGCGNMHVAAPRVMDGITLPVTEDMEADNARFRILANLRINQRFPPGSSASAMKAELYAEGFRPYPMLPHRVVAPDPRLAHEIVNAETRLADFNFRHRTLRYDWPTPRAPPPFCARGMTVRWTEDASGQLLTVRGAAWDACSG
jgi:hypothetical protein